MNLSDFNTSSDDKIIFFLGAGSSIPAGVDGVVGLVDNYKKYVKSKSELDFKIINEITVKLSEWIAEQKIDRQVDIELVLETIERLENREKDIILKFYEDQRFIFDDFKMDAPLSEDLKLFVRKNCFISSERIGYLKDLVDFVDTYGIVDIFSTNYDNSIEQLCEEYGITFIDGFDSSGLWNAKRFTLLDEDNDKGIRLYKLHGSITWRQTEEEEILRIPIHDPNERILLASGKSAVPLILYPGRKLEYSPPVVDTLVELEKRLRIIEYAFVIGYSFKDPHLVALFQHAAKKNAKLVLFLVSPSSYRIYSDKLEYYDDERFHSFSKIGFTRKGFFTPSKLRGRIICLPYKIEQVLPFLKDYIDNFTSAKEAKKEIHKQKKNGQEVDWRKYLNYYMDCEYTDKVEKILNEISWEDLVAKDWAFSFTLSFKGLLHSISNDNQDSILVWRRYFALSCQAISVDKYRFIPIQSTSYPTTVPLIIELKSLSAGGNITPQELVECLQSEILSIARQKLHKLSDGKHSKIYELADRIQSLISYLRLWSQNNMTYDQYFGIRSERYPSDIEQLRKLVDEYVHHNREDRQESITNIINHIEYSEIVKIYGSNILIDNPKIREFLE